MQRLAFCGGHLEPMTPDELVRFIRAQQQAWTPVIAAIVSKAAN
jgi:hypothetical protein